VPSTSGFAVANNFGGTSAAVDVSIATGICIGWTLSVAGTVTPTHAFIQSLN
jgi:predicted Kef-type K+ transport protein